MKNLFNINLFIFFIIFLIIIINLIISYNKNIHPLIVGIVLLLLSIINSININIIIDNHWYSFLIYLIIIGGILILFLYFTSFVINIKFFIEWRNLKIFPVKFMLFIIINLILILIYSKINFLCNKFNEINNLNENYIYNFNYSNNLLTLIYLYNKSINFITLFIIIYLFFVLTIIVKICLFKKKTIRKLN